MNRDGTRMVSSPSEVHCNRCDHLNLNVDIFDDLNTGDWAYIFECVACEHINDEHGTREDRGSADVIFSVVMFVGAVLLISAWGGNWALFWGITWTIVGLAAASAYVLFIIAVTHGAKQGERNE